MAMAINNAPCHSSEHEICTFNNWIHKPQKLPLNNANKTKQFSAIVGTAGNNGYEKE
jgi:hypothetical protein